MDGLTLAVDAAAGSGTIAVFRDGQLLHAREVVMRSEEEERFLPAVIDALMESGIALADCARIVCGGGPGSFTSLRVVAAAAKGLAQGGGLPLLSVPSLALTVAASDATASGPGRWLSTLDAMRGDRYLALVSVGPAGELLSYEALGLAAAAELPSRATELQATLIGPDEAVRAAPHARGLPRCAALLASAPAVDLASWEPIYGRLAEAQVKWEAAQGRPLR